jgi:hypothetical protein
MIAQQNERRAPFVMSSATIVMSTEVETSLEGRCFVAARQEKRPFRDSSTSVGMTKGAGVAGRREMTVSKPAQ